VVAARLAAHNKSAVEGKYVPPDVGVRDRRTLEVRSFYPLPRGQNARGYMLQSYLFIPNNFGINEQTYLADDFYRTAQVLMRVKAVGLSFDALVDLNHSKNPAAVLRRALDELVQEEAPPLSSLQALAQMFGAELADAIRRSGRHIHEHLDTLEWMANKAIKRQRPVDLDDDLLAHLDDSVAELCDLSVRALGVLHRVRSKALAYKGVVHESLFASLGFAEEYATAILDEELALLGSRIEALGFLRDGSGRSARLRLRLARAASDVNQRRVDRGFGVPWGKSPEYFSYRLSTIKKELQRSLYIDTRSDGRDPFVKNSAAMVAAGLAATWATLAQLPLWTGKWSSSEGAFFLSAAVGAYILKDRIKEWTRNLLVKRFGRWDRTRKIVGNALDAVGLGTFGGQMKETMRFVDEEELPDEVRRLRLAHRTVDGVVPELEQVLLHERHMHFGHGDQLPDGYGAQEVYRLSFDALLKRLDDPVDDIAYYDHETGQFSSREVPKVYHANLILVATCEDSGTRYISRSRVVLNRKGIVRVDPVHVGTLADLPKAA